MVRNTYIYPPGALDADHPSTFCVHSQKMPKYNSISISGYHMQEAGATRTSSSPHTLADGVEYLRAGLAAGLDVDRFAPRLFFWAIGMNFFMKCKNARRGTVVGQAADAVQRRTRSLSLRTLPDFGWSLTTQDVFNNVMRTTIEAMAATQGHTQSLHTNALDEALALPTISRLASPATRSCSCSRKAAPTVSSITWGGSLICRTADPRSRGEGLGPHQRSGARRHGEAIEAGVPKLRIERPRPRPRRGSTPDGERDRRQQVQAGQRGRH